jgi:hypothetical protein
MDPRQADNVTWRSGLDTHLLVVLARSTVGAALIASAIWKLRNPQEFRRAFVAAPALIRRVAYVPGLLPGIELIVGGLAVAPSRAGQLGATASFLLVAFFTVVAVGFDNGGSCGCWAEPQSASSNRVLRRAFFVRNAVLMAAAAAGALTADALPFAQAAVVIPLGVLAAFIVLEIPQIAVTATYVQSLAGADRS